MVEARQIVVPSKLRRQVKVLAHESIVGGHLGSKKTLDRIATSFTDREYAVMSRCFASHVTHVRK